MTPTYTIREAADSDIPAILHIHNVRMPESMQVSLEDRKEWLRNAREMGFPIIVASTVATGEPVACASLGSYHPHPVFRLTATVATYVHPDHHRCGLGRLIFMEMTRISREMGLKSFHGLITTDNVSSLQSARAIPNYTHVGSVVFHGSFKVEFFEWLNDNVESSASKFRPFPWGSYTYGEPLFKDRRAEISTARIDDKIYCRL